MPNPKPMGRPRITPGENAVQVTVKIPAWAHSAILREARATGKKPGTLMREALTKYADDIIAYPTFDGRR